MAFLYTSCYLRHLILFLYITDISIFIFLPGAVNGDSIFTYINRQNTSSFSDRSFKPIFLDEVDKMVRMKAEQVCGGPSDLPCIFDFIATQDDQFAIATQETNSDFTQQEQVICKYWSQRYSLKR